MQLPWLRNPDYLSILASAGERQQSKLIDEWWDAFSNNEKKISDSLNNGPEFGVADFMNKKLQAIDGNIMWEYGPACRGEGHRLVITPEDRKDLRPLVAVILDRAPDLNGWEFYQYRLPEDYATAMETVEARTGAPTTGLYFTGYINDFNQLDLTFIALKAKGEEEEQIALDQAFFAVESVLGEEILDKWIGGMEIETRLPLDESHKPMSELADWALRHISEIKASLPDRPFHERSSKAGWILYDLKPDKMDDYPRQEDLVVGKTICEPLWIDAHDNVSFFSERFSKLGELFCYVKIEGGAGFDKERFEDRSPLEEALDNVLIGAGLGCRIGGGIGLRYSYIDLALVDPEKGIDMVRQVVGRCISTKRAWILFYDSELESQWIGIRDDSPAPLMPDFEEENGTEENDEFFTPLY